MERPGCQLPLCGPANSGDLGAFSVLIGISREFPEHSDVCSSAWEELATIWMKLIIPLFKFSGWED